MYWLLFLTMSQMLPLETIERLKPNKTSVSPAVHRGLKAVRVVETNDASGGEERLVVLEGFDFRDGVIELEMAGAPGAGAGGAARGFVGLAFRVSPDLSRYEAFYLRPTNGRAEDQVRRNHSAQYISYPDFPWARLRKEFPEMYESYVDLEPSVWTKVRIEVEGANARLFVHGGAQPTLLVNDLKHKAASGGLALWLGPGTEAYFRNLKVTPKN